jgi:hypothetical protein
MPQQPLHRRTLPSLGARLFAEALLAGGLLAAARPARAAPAPLSFRMLREGSEIGTHRIAFTEAGGELTARAEVAVLVRIVGITVFRLTHRTEEVWAGDRLRRFTSRLDRNGTVVECAARPEGNGLALTGGAGPLRLPANAAPLTWWEPSRFGRPLFDSDDGHPLTGSFSHIALPGGRLRWRSGGAEEATATYGPAGDWQEFSTKGEDGSLVTYQRA